MSATADAIIRGGVVVCSRCGSIMRSEEVWLEDNQRIPLLLWRCTMFGHITQAVPLPAAISGTIPRLDETGAHSE